MVQLVRRRGGSYTGMANGDGDGDGGRLTVLSDKEHSEWRLRLVSLCMVALAYLFAGLLVCWVVWGLFLGGWEGPCENINDPADKAQCEYEEEMQFRQEMQWGR